MTLPRKTPSCGFIAIVGRPNVGKSTLLNGVLGQKISITSKKAQTTRHKILGIVTSDDAQMIFVDTPGFQTDYQNALNQAINRNIFQAFSEVDLLVLVTDARQFTQDDQHILERLPKHKPVLLALNKIDLMPDKNKLLPMLKQLSGQYDFKTIVPISARKKQQLDRLVQSIQPLLPVAPFLYARDQLTDRSERFLAAELLREKVFRLLGDELPYGTTVAIETFKEKTVQNHQTRLDIQALLIVGRENHKAILLGKHGNQLKQIATLARQDMERSLGKKIVLHVWVKVKQKWADNPQLVHQYGYIPVLLRDPGNSVRGGQARGPEFTLGK